MQLNLHRVGEVAELTATGSPEEVASLLRLIGFGAFEMPSIGKVQIHGSLKDADPVEPIQEDDGA